MRNKINLFLIKETACFKYGHTLVKGVFCGK